MKILNTILLILVISQLELTYAEEVTSTIDLKEYDVEIIIFEDAHARYLSSQTWSQPIQPVGKNILPENTDVTAAEKPTNFKSIEPSILKVNHKKLSTSSEYNILFYGAWRQAGLDKGHAFEINISDLDNHHAKQSASILSGKFKLVLARYLHIYSELEYQRKPITAEKNTLDNAKINNELYPLNNHRRMRSRELHYIDHPLVGMLIQINPAEIKEEKK